MQLLKLAFFAFDINKIAYIDQVMSSIFPDKFYFTIINLTYSVEFFLSQ